MLTRIYDRVVELVVDRLWAATARAWKSGLGGKALLLSMAGALAAVAILGGSLVRGVELLLHVPVPGHYEGPIDRHGEEVLRTVERLEAILETELLKIRSEEGLLDAWTYADILVALDMKNAADLTAEDHVAFLLDQARDGRCWTQYRQGWIDRPCHLAATAWVLLALAKLDAPAPSETWRFLLAEQDTMAGWWALYEEAGQTSSNASLYATAILVVAIDEHLEDNLVPRAELEAVSGALARASQWLISVQLPEGCRWLDYPYRGNDAEEFGALSALAMHALARVEFPGIDAIHRRCLERFSAEEMDLGTVSVSNKTIRFADGSTSDDHVRHENLIWQGVAMEACYRYGGLVEKARVRLFMRRLLAQYESPEHRLRRWHQAEFLIMLKNMLGRDVL